VCVLIAWLVGALDRQQNVREAVEENSMCRTLQLIAPVV